MLYSRSLLVIHFKYSSVYMTFPKSLSIPLKNIYFYLCMYLAVLGLSCCTHNVLVVAFEPLVVARGI